MLLAQVAEALDAAHEGRTGASGREDRERDAEPLARPLLYQSVTKKVSSQIRLTATGQIMGTIDDLSGLMSKAPTPHRISSLG